MNLMYYNLLRHIQACSHHSVVYLISLHDESNVLCYSRILPIMISALCINLITITRESTVHDVLQHSQVCSHHSVVYLISTTS